MGQTTFTIHGRTSFHTGKSENPTIGTVEDWFLINTIFFPHPIHIHLINFQVIASYDVRWIILNPADPFANCALYQLDIILAALEANPSAKLRYKDAYGVNGAINYTYLCLNRKGIQMNQQLQYAFNSIFPEDSKDPITRISGMNAFLKISSIKKFNYDNLVLVPPINWQNPSQMIYIASNKDLDFKPYYRKWKDTAYVDGFKMLQIRIRWTKSEYNEAQDKPRGTYFHVPVDQLREYPGYVYHCHILTHEDNEMMRPIMMQLPSDYKLDPKVPCNYDEKGLPLLKWSDKY